MRYQPDALMLFAAGYGKRMGALTADCPKPLIRVGGKTLLDHALALADAVGVKRKVVNLHYLSDQIAAHLAARSDIDLSVELPDILETGGGLRQALPLLGPGPVFTLNTDAVWTGHNPLETLHAAWQPDQMDALLVLVRTHAAPGYHGTGDFDLSPDGRIIRGRNLVYVGAQILRTQGLYQIPERIFSLNLFWDRIIADGRAFGVLHAGGWCDVGTPAGIAAAEAMLRDADV